jgi:hypothetical protein
MEIVGKIWTIFIEVFSLLKHDIINKRTSCGRVDNTPVSYCVGSRFKS